MGNLPKVMRGRSRTWIHCADSEKAKWLFFYHHFPQCDHFCEMFLSSQMQDALCIMVAMHVWKALISVSVK